MGEVREPVREKFYAETHSVGEIRLRMGRIHGVDEQFAFDDIVGSTEPVVFDSERL